MNKKKIEVEPLFRGFQVKRDGVDEEARTVELSFSSEEPYERWFGIEILDHSQGAVDLSRLSRGGALLMDHDPRDQVGVVEKVEIGADRKGRAVVRFGNSQRANEIFNDVKDGIRTNVSVGYEIQEMTLEKQEEGQPEVYRVNRWLPFEVSLVAVPADPTVGVSRHHEKTKVLIRNLEEPKMDLKAKENGAQEAPAAPTVDATAVRNEERKNVQTEMRELVAVGQQFDAMDLVSECMEKGHGVDQLRKMILERNTGSKLVEAQAPTVGLSQKETRQYSILRAMNALANPHSIEAQKAASFEREVSDAACKQMKKEARGILIPMDILARSMSVGTAGDGGNLVATDLLSGSFIESLENALALRQCGATILTGLNGNVAIPRQTGGASHYWIGEDGAPTESNATFDQVAMTPKTVGAFTDISRKLLLQSSLDAEAFAQNELALRLALAIDYAGIAGTGAGNQPTGILNAAGIGSVAGGTNGLAPAWSHVVDLETEAGDANALVQNMCYLTNARVRGALKQTEKAANTAQFIWSESNMLNGYNAVVSNQVPKDLTKGTGTDLSAIIFGNFADLIIGMWGGLDLQLDPYTQGTKGAVRITALQDVDIAIRHPESFAAMQDAITG